MDEKLRATIDKIVKLTQQNHEFNIELRKKLEMTSSATAVYSSEMKIKDDVTTIREALEIRANKSISYDFINNQRLRDQLIIDNLRMENAALNLQDDENERFYIFCVNAFYQIENVVNYYYYITYPDINDLVSAIVAATKNDGENYAYKPKDKKEKNVADIDIYYKLNAFCNTFFPKDKIKITYSTLRKVRNEGEHRCMVIINNNEEDSSLYKFFMKNTFNTVRIILIKLVDEVKKQIEAQIYKKEVVGTIKTMLPSACFVSYGDETQSLPSKLMGKVHGLKDGDKIIITLKDKEILDVK